MSRIKTFILGLIFSLTSYGQDANSNTKISLQDSTLLNNFWTEFKTAVNTNNEVKLSALFNFPFYCAPCVSDTTLKNNDGITVKVTKETYNKSLYKFFFAAPFKNTVRDNTDFRTYLFHRSFDNKNKPKGFMFSYTIIAPSKTWEGSQGLIFLGKINGKYKIMGIDRIP